MNNTKVLLGLGSNEGKRMNYIQMARYFIESEIGNIIQQSNIYESESWGIEDQDLYLNQVIEIETILKPHYLLDIIHQIETKLGRKRNFHWSSRTIDIDILTYDNLSINDKNLIIPHQYLTERNFVLVPLCEIASDKIHPLIGEKYADILTKCIDKKEVKLYHGA